MSNDLVKLKEIVIQKRNKADNDVQEYKGRKLEEIGELIGKSKAYQDILCLIVKMQGEKIDERIKSIKKN